MMAQKCVHLPVIFGPPTSRCVTIAHAHASLRAIISCIMPRFARQPPVYGHSHASKWIHTVRGNVVSQDLGFPFDGASPALGPNLRNRRWSVFAVDLHGEFSDLSTLQFNVSVLCNLRTTYVLNYDTSGKIPTKSQLRVSDVQTCSRNINRRFSNIANQDELSRESSVASLHKRQKIQAAR